MGERRRQVGTIAAGIAAAGLTASAAAPIARASTEPPAAGFSIVGALTQLPEDVADDASFITVGNVEAATELAGLSRPASFDDEGFLPWLMAISGTSTTEPGQDAQFAPVPVMLSDELVLNAGLSDEIDALLGFSAIDIAWFAEASAPPSGFAVFGGDFDEATLSPDLVDLGGGVVSLGEGDDFAMNPQDVTPASRIGVPQRLAYSDGLIALSPETALVRSWVAGSDETAADEEELAAVAAALDAAGAQSALFGELGELESLGPDVTPEQREALLERLGSAVPDDSFEMFGVGWSSVDGQSVITIVYQLDENADPEAAADLLRTVFDEGESLRTQQPLRDLLVLDHVAADGGLVIATTHPGPDGRPLTPFDMVQAQDVPFVTIELETDGD